MSEANTPEVSSPISQQLNPSSLAEPANPPAAPQQQRFATTQLGNAERLVFRHGDKLLYCSLWKKWLVWDRRRWVVDQKEQVKRLAKDTVVSMYSEARRIQDDHIRDQMVKHASRSQRNREIDDMIELAKGDFAITPTQMDRDPWLLNCQNGTLDLRSGTCHEHRPIDYITKLSPVSYDQNAECPTWNSFLDRILGNNKELISFMQQCFGYALTGSVAEKALFVLVGGGDNGKTTMLEAFRHIMGDYAGTIEINHLMSNASNSEQERTIAELHGRRFVTASEAQEGQRFNESKIKNITGGGTLIGRRLYGHQFEFEPAFKLFIDANHKPVVRGSDNAIWNRFRLVLFNVSIPKAEQDRRLLGKLKAEGPGILAWAVRGCLEWQKKGHLPSPSAVASAVEEYRKEMDSVQEFVDDCCVAEPESVVTFSDLYARYCGWCGRVREDAISQTALGRWLTSHGYEEDRIRGARCRRGLGLIEIPSNIPQA